MSARGRDSDGKAPSAAPVVWRDGVHLAGTVLWCDARRARAVCFASSARALGRAGHGQLIGTAETLAMVQARPAERLVAPMRRAFSLGNLRLELAPSGHAAGAAMLAVDHDGRRILYADRVAPDGVGLGGAAVARACDVLVVAAPYGRREHKFPPPAAAARALVAWATDVCAAGEVAVVKVGTAAFGLDVAAKLVEAGIACAAHRAIHATGKAIASAGATAPVLRGQRGVAGRALVWLGADDRGLARALGRARGRVALVSGRAVDATAVRAAGASHGVVWSDAADRARLVAFVRACEAAQVFLTGECADDVRAALGKSAVVLAPPRQLTLWGGA